MKSTKHHKSVVPKGSLLNFSLLENKALKSPKINHGGEKFEVVEEKEDQNASLLCRAGSR